ncbi:UBX domain-containing protein 10 [Chiroxiphia lanceolata]|uniref:UBX domain-containing protein 10 n=1 Tax=Chiroxiphia lanceolata TaxID=296741 RepID=UPI0013CE621A|nr:UBX domain-containing protein 10 [Chiroxiphia lanceolata]XP_032564599.1 UBX domain-containing protein 10 [Chiroxiphia lanceolata]XP_032564600.1 UBX domain-containing protein 10 [Chiroxiphia lanceolata]XP_032564601.1 UBX domain-containing protein 10 [Chiroxiphia lanceolata]
MATVAFLDAALIQLCFPPSTAALLWANTVTMHVTRPKSAKGRRRPSFSHPQDVEACPCQVPSSPPAATPRGLVSSQRAPLTKLAFPPTQVSPEEIPELLQQVPLKTSSSLNKYRVLPSIGWKGVGSNAMEALAQQTHRLEVSEGQKDTLKFSKTLSGEQGSGSTLSGSDVPAEESSHMHCPPEKRGRKMRQESPSMSPLSLEEPHVLLAVRSPSGQRFEHHFKPSDSLLTVLAMAGQKLLANYQHCSIETMEVPRRSFSDLTKSLHECGILHKSVLCIRQDKQHDAADL